MKNRHNRVLRLCAVTALALALQACASVAPRNPVPKMEVDKAVVSGGSLARLWGDATPPDLSERVEVYRKQLAQTGGDVYTRRHHHLLISGGGANGAFGAGLLKGWSDSGTRPQMTIVTGISTGALIAPYAFLGSDYDADLERLYTSISTKDLIKPRPLLASLRSDALYDTEPLRRLLRTEINTQMIAAIAREYEEGRRLLIGTTNLDARRPVIWNIGAIAMVGTEESAQLIRDVMLASASIPGLFPPVRITVKVGGRTYEELHVDGGVSSQVFLYPAQLDLGESAETLDVSGKQSVYVIRNGILEPRWEVVPPKIGAVAITSIETLIRTQGMGDLYRIYLSSKRDGNDFRLAFIPSEFNSDSEENFDPKHMRELFDLGYQMSRNGYDWATSPPGIVLP